MSTLQAVVELVDKMSAPLAALTKNVADFAKGVADGAKEELTLAKNGETAAKSQDSLKSSLMDVGKALLGLKVAKDIFDGFAKSILAADKLDEMAAKTGIATARLKGMQTVAETSDSSLEALVKSMQKLNRGMAMSEEDTTKQAEAFRAMGISIEDSAGNMKSSETIFNEIADKFKGMKDGADKSALAFSLFGMEGENMIPILNKGSEELKAATEEAQLLGQMGPEAFTAFAASASDMQDGLVKVNTSIGGVFDTIAGELVPIFNVMINEFIDSVKQGGLVAQIFDAIKAVAIGGFIPAMKGVVIMLYSVSDVIKIAGKSLGALGAMIAAVASGDIAGAKAIWKSYKEDVANVASEHVKFTDKLMDASNASDIATKALNATGDAGKIAAPKMRKVATAAKEIKSDLEAMVIALQNSNAAFGFDDSVKQRLEAYSKYQKDLKAGVDPAKAQALLNEAQAQITINAALKDGKDAADAYNKAQTTVQEDELKVKVLELEASMVGKSKSERDAAVQVLMDEAEVRKITNGLTGDAKTKIEEEIKAMQARRAAAKGSIEDETRLQGLVSGTLVEQEKKAREDIQFLSEAYSAGRIKSEDEYVQAVLLRLSQVKDANKAASDEITVFWQEAAKGMQNSMSSFFFDIMQGKTSDLASSFKNMLDKMVSDALAANLADAMFGSAFTKTGSLGGFAKTGLDWVSGLFSGARASGGSVEAGKMYMVGEKGPEPFIPSVSGTIMPNSSLTGVMGSGGSNVNIAITAMDSQDVRRALEKDNRWLSDLVNKTNRAYNLGR